MGRIGQGGAVVIAALLTSSWVHAEPVGNILTEWNQTGLGFIADGTSNTIAFSESTQLSICLRGVSLQGSPAFSTITDGSSNTILFGEIVPRACFESVRVREGSDEGTSVPEPATLWMVGLAAAAAFARRAPLPRR